MQRHDPKRVVLLREIEKKYDNARSDPRILPDDSGKVKTIEIKLADPLIFLGKIIKKIEGKNK